MNDMNDFVDVVGQSPTKSQFPTLGAAIIVKNAEKTIGRTLGSLTGLVDQIVVVDTGSTDGTAEIVSRSGADLYFKRWEDDFSKARNHALGFLRTEWCLIIDADEQLDAQHFAAVRTRMDDAELGGLQVCIHNSLSENSSTSIDHHYTRIFRRHPAIRFRGIIHEQIAESIRECGLRIDESEAEIYHDGYRQVTDEKTERNSSMLKRELERDPDDVWTKYHLGLTEFGAGRLQEAFSLLKELRISPMLTVEQQETATIRCAQCALAEDNFMLVEELLMRPCVDSEREGLRQYVLGAAYCNQLNFAAGLRSFTLARQSQTRLVDQEVLQKTIEQINSLRRH